MSNRFHNKYHRHNHHTDRINDPRYPDSSHDPIASPDYPFLGDFVMFGGLSAIQTQLSAFAGSFINPAGPGLKVQGVDLGLQVKGDTNLLGGLSAQQIEFTTNIKRTFNEYQSVSATGEFLIIKVAGDQGGGEPTKQWAIRLWDASAFMPE